MSIFKSDPADLLREMEAEKTELERHLSRLEEKMKAVRLLAEDEDRSQGHLFAQALNPGNGSNAGESKAFIQAVLEDGLPHSLDDIAGIAENSAFPIGGKRSIHFHLVNMNRSKKVERVKSGWKLKR